jgi:hypothetical protein
LLFDLASVMSMAGSSAGSSERSRKPDVQTLMRTHAPVIRADDDRVRAVVDDHFGVRAGVTSTPRNEDGGSATSGDGPGSPLTSTSYLDASRRFSTP